MIQMLDNRLARPLVPPPRSSQILLANRIPIPFSKVNRKGTQDRVSKNWNNSSKDNKYQIHKDKVRLRV